MTSGKTENIQEENLETFSSTQLAPFSLGNESPSDENTPWNKKAVATIKLYKKILQAKMQQVTSVLQLINGVKISS